MFSANSNSYNSDILDASIILFVGIVFIVMLNPYDHAGHDGKEKLGNVS